MECESDRRDGVALFGAAREGHGDDNDTGCGEEKDDAGIGGRAGGVLHGCTLLLLFDVDGGRMRRITGVCAR